MRARLTLAFTVSLGSMLAGPAMADVPSATGAKGTERSRSDDDLVNLINQTTTDSERAEAERAALKQRQIEQAAADAARAAAEREKANAALAEARRAALKNHVVTPEGVSSPGDAVTMSAVAATVKALTAVERSSDPRHPGPYELGELDCRVVDASGIERVMPRTLVAGEEPDLVCRVVVTEPATVERGEHSLTLNVEQSARDLSPQQTFHQTRVVRMPTFGRRAVMFFIPSSQIEFPEGTNETQVNVRVTAMLSGPAVPAKGRELHFSEELVDP